MVSESRNGQMAPDTKVYMFKVTKRVKENFIGQMDQVMKVNFWIIIYTEKVYIYGEMEEFIKENG